MYQFSRLAFLLCTGFFAFAQEDDDSKNSVRQEYKLPDPTYYEGFYDIKIGVYYVYPKIGELIVGNAIVMTPEEYQKFMLAQAAKAYYKDKSAAYSSLFRKDNTEAQRRGLIQTLNVRNRIFETIFGGNTIEIIPNGFASFDLGGLYQKIDNPLILPQNRTSFAFDIEQRIQLGLTGKVGENLTLKANYDTQSGFAFENRTNLIYQNKGTWQDLQQNGVNNPKITGEDKIIKRVEFGNINMPLSTSLIRGSESLFGLKTEFQLGKTNGTAVFSQQQGEARNIVVQGGGVLSTFKVNAIDYEDNQHYFIGHYFRDNYDQSLLNYPQINSKISITKMEVWVLDQGNGSLAFQKSIVGVRDLGDGVSGLPDNSQNNLFQSVSALGAPLRDANTAYNTINGQSFPNANGVPESYQDGEQFIFNRKARKLNSNEYSYNPQLGYISLNSRLNDNQLLATSFSYTVNGSNKVYKVGEFAEESPVIITKVLKPNTNVKTTSPMWDLMMKNIYPLDAYQVNPDGFILNVYYRDPQTGGKVNYLPNTIVEDTNLLKLFNWDRLNINNDVQNNGTTTGDGLFDFVEGITVKGDEGKVIFTKVEPFGSFMQSVLGSNNPQYVFNDLYDQQKQVASQSNLALRYTMEGRYKGAQGDGISLGAINVPEGSVQVTANGVQLQEGIDYTVNYLLGSVTIINEQVKQSGQAINISLENNLTFNTQRKRFVGLNLERKVSDNFLIAASVVNYSETPLTQKVNFGQEAVNNTMAGFNILYNNKLPFLTRITDKIPLINTEAPSNLNFKMEAAYLFPGLNNATNSESYIDDFEQTSSKISLKEPSAWNLASKPEKNQNNPIFAGAGQNNSLANGNGRGLLTWYNIDPRFYGVGGKAPDGIDAQAVSNHASRRVRLDELFATRDFVAGEQIFTNTFDLSFFPAERGPYNYNNNTETPQQRWSGLMRPISVSNFVNSNIEYVEFWMMDPYADGNTIGTNPKVLLQLGNVSEDVLKDGLLQYENGLPTATTPSTTTSSNLGTQPNQPPILYAFSSDGAERAEQDAGYDGLTNAQEAAKFPSTFVNPVLNTPDPSADDFVFYLSDLFQGNLASYVPSRYKYFRNLEGNSKSNTLEVASQTPDAEDINRDYNLDQSENYNQYTINLEKSSLVVGQNNIVNEKTVKATFENGQESDVKWYLFRIPVEAYDPSTIGGDADPSVLNNVRFARMLLTGFETASTVRFGTFDLVRSDYRRYTKNIFPVAGPEEGTQLIDNSNFEVGSVNLEENGLNQPPYVLPPGIDRQVLSGSAGAQRQNEASLYLKATGLGNVNAEARGVFKNISLDMRRYKKLQMFVHAEDLINKNSYLDPSTKFFIRFGSDATDNYYEYESSLQYTDFSATSPLDIWPAENEVNLELQNFIDLKIRRDKNSSVILNRYTDADYGDTDKKIYVKGRPSLGNVSTIMIGVRKNGSSIGERSKDVVLWVNEIRLSDIENEGGYAGNASLNFNLGDFAVVNANASYSSVGFGNIDSRPAERSQASQSAYSVNTTINVDKFLPEKSGMKIPLTYSYSQTIEDPKYNPLDTDVTFAEAANQEQLKEVARTYTQQRSIGVVNMRKEITNTTRKPRPYDVENLSLTMIYNDDFYRDIYTKRNYRQYLNGYLEYNYSFKPFVIKPFNKLISDTAKSAKKYKFIKDFNFNPVPTRFSFRTDIDRNYNELEFRNIESIINGNFGNDFDVLKNRNFYFGWQYALGFNFTKSFKVEINSATRTLNDDQDVNLLDNRSIFQNAFRAGRPVLYNHKVQANYRVPFQLIPAIDFISAELSYGFAYNWNARSTALLNSPDGSLGSIGQNTNDKIATGKVDFPKLFKKFKYFQKIDSVMLGRKREVDSLNNAYTKSWEKGSYAYKPYKFKNKLKPLQAVAYAFTAIKQLDFNYSENNGTVLPGLLSAPNYVGYGQTLGGPTYGFLFGSQADIRRTALENGWLSTSEFMTDPYLQLRNRTLTANLQVIPANDLRIDFNVLSTYNRNFSQSGFNSQQNLNTANHDFTFATEFVTYSNTAIMAKTAFKSGEDIYANLIANAKEISQQIPGAVGADGFVDGYGLSNSYVLIPAFRAAVEGRSSKSPLGNPTKSGIPIPNWRLIYSGLKNIPIISGQFAKFDIQHSYNSTYTATGVQSGIDFFNNPGTRDVNGDFYNPYTFSQVGYVEQFAPLIGVDVTMRNNVQFRAQYNRDRLFMLGLVNHTLTEDSGTGYVLGFGYIIKDFRLGNLGGPTGRGGARTTSDLNIRGDVELRDNRTMISNILLDDSQVTGGQRLLTIKLSADYSVNKNVNLRLFYDQLMTKYKISTAFPLTTVRAGISATFTFDEGGF
ncbi:cell surface protein SprA [Frigoriflavimonas asaccharolytica]|uniref:T9SS outer membrane translocon Sov/SprA n=1 Tax=Frigoriflavimonas asaccharolytica TaxID=2735899 RepID=UPI00360E7430